MAAAFPTGAGAGLFLCFRVLEPFNVKLDCGVPRRVKHEIQGQTECLIESKCFIPRQLGPSVALVFRVMWESFVAELGIRNRRIQVHRANLKHAVKLLFFGIDDFSNAIS